MGTPLNCFLIGVSITGTILLMTGLFPKVLFPSWIKSVSWNE
jgi:hypothetical protein